ncbi:hypothetical protein [Embleya scabrispora]|uniref:hypothetical protein n=1 Tax=Embleya scabrispora TaxID=159449 RepID=UPI0003643079|nr:hypothetical protein [Embleya scabrispora]MYS79186.1 hypothetical protein [Streptomyces sp. SID5474]
MLNVTGSDGAESAALLLTTMHRLHEQLNDFTSRLYAAYDFGDESGLVPAVSIEMHPAGPELRHHHRFGFFTEGDSDVSELRFSAGATTTSAGSIVERGQEPPPSPAGEARCVRRSVLGSSHRRGRRRRSNVGVAA